MKKQDYFTLNKQTILNKIKEYDYVSTEQLKEILQAFKEESLVSTNLSFNAFLLKLIDEGITQNSVTIRGHIKIRYTFKKDFDIYNFCNALEKNSYFSMTTSLNIQGLSNYRSDYIFVSKERVARVEQDNIKLLQINIDNAFAKKPRRTTAYDKVENYMVIMLEANNTAAYEIIDYNGFKLSSVNRAFVEIISNIHYFQTSNKALELFSSIKNNLDIDKIYTILEKFDFIYPYFQLAGFYLENIGFSKNELIKYYKKKSELNFYTEKNRDTYLFDEHWNIYY
ncbi:MAG: hypothetical protein WC141_05620 [Arcobacteraceae bacterium]